MPTARRMLRSASAGPPSFSRRTTSLTPATVSTSLDNATASTDGAGNFDLTTTLPRDRIDDCTTYPVRYEAQGIRLEFSMQLNAARIGGTNCPSGSVAALATIIPDGDWEIRASTLEGEPLSAGVLGDGTLLVGRFTGSRACPCLTQP